jgi:predicted MFS family arabinose efflux permease
VTFFDALAHRDFRVWWGSFLVVTVTMRMQFFAVGWLVVLIAAAEGAPERAALYLGILGMARAIPAIILGLIAGVAVDRIDRRVLLIVSHGSFGVIFSALGLTALSGTFVLWTVLASGAMYAATSVLYVPTRQAIQPRLVGQRDLRSAIGLISIALNCSAFIGPLLGGLLIVPVGVGGVLLISGAAQFLVMAALFFLSPYPVTAVGPRTSVARSLIDGLGYVRSKALLFWILAAYGVNLVVVDPYVDLLPALASQVFGMGPVQLSWLLAAGGVGSLSAGVVIASVRGLQRYPIATIGALALAGLLLAVFVRQRELAVLLVAACGIGFATMFAGASLNLIIQTTTPDHFRGRVSSLSNLLVDAGTPTGALTLGVVATAIGVDNALTIAGLTMVAVAVLIGSRPALGRIPASESPVMPREASIVTEP